MDLTPNPKKHLIISIIKSGTRIFGYFALFSHHIWIPITLLVLSELLGVVEELV